MSIGSKVRFYREKKEYSQEDLATLLDVAQTTISSIESDKSVPNAILLSKIAEELDVDINELLSDSKVIQKNKTKVNNGAIGNYNTVNNYLSEKLIEQYEARIKELKEYIDILRKEKS
ncbi:MAG: helix-turn-helix domain-containing protein [Moheibacter sp.]